MISSHHLATTLLFDVLRRLSQYLNMCMAALDYKVVEAPGACNHFYLKPILVKLERVCYINPILPVSLVDLFAGRRSASRGDPKSGGGGSGDGGSGNKKPCPMCCPRREPHK